jgi:hypothetical protein
VTPPVAYLHFPEQTAAIDVIGLVPLQLSQQDTLRLDLVGGDEGIAANRQVILEIIRADGSVERIRLDENVLDDLLKTVSDLPDGRYRFLLLEPGESRLRTLLDLFEVRQGKIVDESDTGDRPPSSGLRPAKPTGDDVPADAEEAIRNAHPNASASTSDGDGPVLADDLPAASVEGNLMSGWKSMSARRAWRRAERVADEILEQSREAGVVVADDHDTDAVAADEGQTSQASVGAAVVAGAVFVGLGEAKSKVVDEVTARFSRAARLFRRLGSKPK